MDRIIITGAAEGNLQNLTVEIPKNKLVVFTGLSGSGKSTLLVDVLFQECQRQYLEAMAMQGIRKPKVQRVQGASPAVLIAQSDANKSPRSTVGTVTDLSTSLRMVFEKLAVRACPHCGAAVCAADCREITEKDGDDFLVFMDCCRCGKRMSKLTRTQFSFNTKEGACPVCEGLGQVHTADPAAAVDEALSPEAGAVRYWEKKYGEYQTGVLYAAFAAYGVPAAPGTPVAQYGPLQKAIFYEGVACAAARQECPGKQPPKTVAQGRFEGVLPILRRRLAEKGGAEGPLASYFRSAPCPACGGERLNALSRSAAVQGTRLPELARRSLDELDAWTQSLFARLPAAHRLLVEDYLRDMQTKLRRLCGVGLGYLSLDRQTVTLSGGELQRLRLAAVLDCDLSGILYILDEPTAGLHPKDTAGLVAVLQKLRDLGNSVLVIEHDPDVMAAADHIIDLGPGAGRQGGRVVGAGTLAQLKAQKASVTGAALRSPQPGKTSFRPAGPAIAVRGATRFNLHGLDADIPTNCLTAVTGPSGSGKSTLVFEVLAKGGAQVQGLERFSGVVEVGQSAISRMKRSNVATYAGAYDGIRALFAQTEDARRQGLTARHFSFNVPGGRCETCQGLGTVDSNMLFFTDIQTLCPVCGGRRFSPAVLGMRFQGLTIGEVLALPVTEAVSFFKGHAKACKPLQLLEDVGLGYLQLGQTLTTLSGGECQRLKLAKELAVGGKGRCNLYLLDEPTRGLHPVDVTHFLRLLDRLVDAGHSVVVVEHNQQVILHSDWVIDLGPGGGEAGGRVVFAGTPRELLQNNQSVTAQYLKSSGSAAPTG